MLQHIPQAFVQDLLARVDIVELVQSRLALKKMGSNFAACCPFHNEKTPSFTVSVSKQFYHCFGCGAHGNTIGFLMAYDNLEFVEAVEELARYLGVAIPETFSVTASKPQLPLYALLDKINQYYQVQLKRSPKTRAYLQARGLSEEMIRRFGIGFAPAGWDNVLRQFGTTSEVEAQLLQAGMLIKTDQGKIYDRFRDRLMIPIRDQRGRAIAFGSRSLGDNTPKYLNSPETLLFHKGSELFGLYEARQGKAALDFCLIVEGYMDVMALHQFGITQAVGTMGTAVGARHLQRLFRYTKNLIFCFDGDNAGQNAAWRALENSLPLLKDGVQIRFMFLPVDQDPDSSIRQEGVTVFQQRISNAVSLSDFLFSKLIAQTDLTTADGKAKLVQLAKQPLHSIPMGVFRELMLQKLASCVGMSQDVVEKYLLSEEPATPAQSTYTQSDALLQPTQAAIAMLLQYPELAQRVACPAELQQVTLPGVTTLLGLFRKLQDQPALSAGALFECWRDSKVIEQIAKLAVWKLLIPPGGMEAELSGTLSQIIAQNREMQIQSLQAKWKQQAIDAVEKMQLLKLLEEKLLKERR